ncbi:CRN1 [Candida theae]|uniref:Coronin n=1 Tax=Candida theae TaxID=1198502 RepID=A0AAD5BFT4_9ASCO|nr:CRN1 [Candida theae]KAI5959108.1 CRN1 [Candida theae]
MSGKFVRASKYRHVFGQGSKKELCYENLKITKNAWDSNIIQTNGKYISANWDASGGGAFAVIPVEEVGKAPDKVSLFRGHKGPVLDTAFNPFDSQEIASCSDDGKILIWKIPQDYSFHRYLDENDEIRDITEPSKVLSGHTRKVGLIEYHPCAANILASSSLDYTVKIWNTETGKDEITLQHKDLVTSFAFNYNGSLLATTSRDKKLRIWDVREGKVLSEGPGHTGAKPSRITWLGNTDRIVTTGFSKLSDRQVGVWDIQHIDNGPIGGFMVIDASSGVLVPYFDPANSILYLAGKGDGNIRYYEYDTDELYELSQYASTDPQRGFAVVPKHSVNVKENEVLRAFKTVLDTSIEPISFIVPRRSELFQSDIYPDCPSTTPALSAEEWLDGKEVNGPVLMNMEALYEGKEPSLKDSKPATNVSEVKEAKSRDLQKQKEEAGQKKEQEKKSKESSPLPLSSSPRADKSEPAKKEGQSSEKNSSLSGSPDKNVDELLQKSNEVGSLLNKVANQSDEEETSEAEESKDDGWEEVKKPETKSVSPAESKIKEDGKSETVTSAPLSTANEQENANLKLEATSTEPKPTKAENKVETPKLVNDKEKNEKDSAPSSKDKSKEEAKTASDEDKSTKPTNARPTLASTIDRLSSLVSQFESHIVKLEKANLDKDERLKALEDKIESLLKK